MKRLLGPLVVAALLVSSCSAHHASAPVPAPEPADPAPTANTPANALRRLVWAWNQRDTTTCRSVFADDYTFVFAVGDSSGDAWRTVPWGVAEEWRAIGHLLRGGGVLAPALSTGMVVDANLLTLPDPRPGREPRWHKAIHTQVAIDADCVDTNSTPIVYVVSGEATLYLVRGDSAAFGGHAAGSVPDSTHWYIQRWEDETLMTSGGFHPDPVVSYTLGWLKARYLP